MFLNVQALIFREDAATTSRKHRELSEKLRSRSMKKRGDGRSKPLSKEEILKSQRAVASNDVLLNDDANHELPSSEKEESFKLSSTSLGGENKINLDESRKSSEIDGFQSVGIGLDKDYEVNPYSDELRDEYGSWTKRLQKKMLGILQKINFLKIITRFLKRIVYKIHKRLLKLKFVAYLRVKLGVFINDTFYEKREDVRYINTNGASLI